MPQMAPLMWFFMYMWVLLVFMGFVTLFYLVVVDVEAVYGGKAMISGDSFVQLSWKW